MPSPRSPAWAAGSSLRGPTPGPPGSREEFDWVVGCSYRGLPTGCAPVRNLIGANMSFRRSVLAEVGGFRSELGRIGTRPLGCEETELCLRIGRRFPDRVILHEPRARVLHQVPADRASWRYFTARCYSEGLSKATVARLAGARGLSSERSYTLRVLRRASFAGRSGGRSRSPPASRSRRRATSGAGWSQREPQAGRLGARRAVLAGREHADPRAGDARRGGAGHAQRAPAGAAGGPACPAPGPRRCRCRRRCRGRDPGHGRGPRADVRRRRGLRHARARSGRGRELRGRAAAGGAARAGARDRLRRRRRPGRRRADPDGSRRADPVRGRDDRLPLDLHALARGRLRRAAGLGAAGDRHRRPAGDRGTRRCARAGRGGAVAGEPLGAPGPLSCSRPGPPASPRRC